jgi:hypothetical protein
VEPVLLVLHLDDSKLVGVLAGTFGYANYHGRVNFVLFSEQLEHVKHRRHRVADALQQHEVVQRVVPLHETKLVRACHAQVFVAIVGIPGRATFQTVFDVLIAGFSVTIDIFFI